MDDWYLESDAGYRVSRQICRGRADYTAWAPGPTRNPYAKGGYTAILYSRDHKACIEACERHHQEAA